MITIGHNLPIDIHFFFHMFVEFHCLSINQQYLVPIVDSTLFVDGQALRFRYYLYVALFPKRTCKCQRK